MSSSVGSLALTAGLAAACGFACGVAYVDGGFERLKQKAEQAWESLKREAFGTPAAESNALPDPASNGVETSSSNSKGLPPVKAVSAFAAASVGAAVSRRSTREDDVAAASDISPMSSVPSTPLTGSSRAASEAGAGSIAPGEKLKMAIVVIDDAAKRWGPGKLGVMISSACLGLYKRVYKNRALRPTLLTWESSHKASKVVLRAPDEAGLGALMDSARAAGIPAHCLLETGGSSGSRSRAIVALGPATSAALAAAGCQALPSL